MTLRKYSNSEKNILGEVDKIRIQMMSEIGVTDARYLTLDQIEEIVAEAKKVPGFVELSRKNLEAFQTLHRIESEGGLN